MMDYMDIIVKNTNLNQNKHLSQIVYDSLKYIIMSGIIPVGEKIVEKTYAERLNISRTPIREALRILAMEEFVEYVPKKGVAVKMISLEDVIEIFKIRYSLEVLAATEAMNNITEQEIEEIEKLLDLSEQENTNGNTEEVIGLIGEFNLRIYEISGMKRLTEMISKLNVYLKKFRAISMSSYEKRKQAIKEHKEILNTIVMKNKDQIDIIIKKHLEHSLKIVKEEIRK